MRSTVRLHGGFHRWTTTTTTTKTKTPGGPPSFPFPVESSRFHLPAYLINLFAGTVRVADTTDASVTNTETDVDGSVRLAGGLAVEKSAAIQAELSVLSTTDGDASGIGAALYVKGGYHVGGDTYVGGDSMIELGG